MYTKGIKKIYCLQSGTVQYSMACSMAEAAGFHALCFGGIIYIRISEDDGLEYTGWIESCFLLTDFQDVQT